MTATVRDLSVPRPLDRATPVPLDGGDLDALDDAKILAAPDDPALWPAWRRVLHRWRDDARGRHSYDGSAGGPQWASTCSAVRLVWLWDERLYDRASGSFTVDDFVDAGEREYGGFDAVVLWHAYPVIGVDPRNQWDFYRDVPELADVVGQFQARGQRVFVDYNPWDVGTHRAGHDSAQLAALVADYGVDGVFLDTLKEGSAELVELLGHEVALCGESRVSLAALPDHAMSWAQWFDDSAAPGVLRAHWYERRHMMHHTRRWNRDHSAELQSAWVNGCGVLVWDDVFGVWVGWNDRDRATLRAMRRLQGSLRRHFLDGTWTPLADPHPAAVESGVYAHRYDLGEVSVWTVVNRGTSAYRGPVLRTDRGGTWSEAAYGSPVDVSGDTVACNVPGQGIACLVRTSGAVLHSTDDRAAVDMTVPPRRAEAVGATTVQAAAATPPAGTVVVAGARTLAVRYRKRETGQGDETPWVDAWKPLPPDLHAIVHETRDARLGTVAVDVREVSNGEFRKFLAVTGYRPRVPNRFLAHWTNSSSIEDEPVTYVSLDDARAYAAWRGMRLPTPAEWQAAIEDGAGRGEPVVWNWTDSERTDGITRYALLKGGSWYAASGSDWYVDGGEQAPDWELKLVLPGGGLERSQCIGFRCAVDLAK